MKANLIKKILIAGLAIFGILGAEAYAQTGPTATVSVSANVKEACRFQVTGGYSMNINNDGTDIDPALGTPAADSVNLTYRCTNTTVPEFQIGTSGYATSHTGVPVTLNGPTDTMAATFDLTSAGAGSGMGVDKTATLTGNISATVIDAATPELYGATVTVDIRVQP